MWQIIEIYVNKVATVFHIFECPGWKQMPVQAFALSISHKVVATTQHRQEDPHKRQGFRHDSG